MDLQKELKEFAKWLDGSDIKLPIEKMADHYWQEFKAQGISSNAVLKVTKGLPKENKKEKPEVEVCQHQWIDRDYYDECEKCNRRR